MAQITAALVKELRETTGAGMMDCKGALTETDGDMEAAIDWLRKKGLSKAAKKANRVAAEGLIGVAVSDDGKIGAVVEVNSETDFVARNDAFQKLVGDVADAALENGDDRDALGRANLTGASKSVDEHITELVGSIGENMFLRRSGRLSVGDGAVAAYIHNKVIDGLGKIGVLVALDSSGDADGLNTLGRNIGMHIAAMNPLALGPDDLDPAVLERERTVILESEDVKSKPENVREKMVEGRLRKYQQEICLLKQAFVLAPDGKASVEQTLADFGTPVSIAGFVRFALGEGIDKGPEEDFAAEVAVTAAGN